MGNVSDDNIAARAHNKKNVFCTFLFPSCKNKCDRIPPHWKSFSRPKFCIAEQRLELSDGNSGLGEKYQLPSEGFGLRGNLSTSPTSWNEEKLEMKKNVLGLPLGSLWCLAPVGAAVQKQLPKLTSYGHHGNHRRHFLFVPSPG